MSASITFHTKGLEQRLKKIEQYFLPEAGKKALKEFGFHSRKYLADQMEEKYDSVSAYTKRSPFFRQSGFELTIGINDVARGTPPSRYLAPTDRSGGAQQKEIARTSFGAALAARYGLKPRIAPVPIRSSRAGRQFLTAKGNLRPRRLQSLLTELQDPTTSRYFVMPERKGRLQAGIYRRYRSRGGSLSMAFAMPDQRPKVPTKINFREALLTEARIELPVMIQDKLRRLLR